MPDPDALQSPVTAFLSREQIEEIAGDTEQAEKLLAAMGKLPKAFADEGKDGDS